jgi:DNA (cytosine-5)-methyltransferase 1
MTKAPAASLWPTPRAEKTEGTASEGYSPTLHQAVQQWPTPKASNANGASQHGEGSLDLQTMVPWWPTPQSRDWKNGQASATTRHKNTRPLNERVMVIQTSEPARQTEPMPMYLNADWVECLMGFPPGWSIPAGPPDRPCSKQHGSRPGRSHAG